MISQDRFLGILEGVAWVEFVLNGLYVLLSLIEHSKVWSGQSVNCLDLCGREWPQNTLLASALVEPVLLESNIFLNIYI